VSKDAVSYTIYMHTCLVTGKSYVGYTKKTMEQRWDGHAYCAFNSQRAKTGRLHAFQFAIRKHGPDAWVHTVLENRIKTLDKACKAEVRWIAELETLVPNGYNEIPGGHGIKMTPEVKERHRIATKEALNRPDVKARVCESQKRAHNTSESRKRNSEAQKKAQARPDVVEKKRQKMNEFYARPGYRSPRALEIVQFDDDGNVLAVFPTLTLASKAVGAEAIHLSECARGFRKRASGFVWKYVKDIENFERPIEVKEPFEDVML